MQPGVDTHHCLRVKPVFTQFSVSVGFFALYREPGLDFLRTYGSLIKQLRGTESNYPGLTALCKRNASPATFDKDLIYPAVTLALYFPGSVVSTAKQRSLLKFVLPFSIKCSGGTYW